LRGVLNRKVKMPGSKDERHRYGQHYTPREVARLLAAFAIRSSSDLVLDPGCGDGRLLQEAIRLKANLLPPAEPVPSSIAREVYGIDRSASAARLASKTGARVAVTSFFDVEAGSRPCESIQLPSRFDAIIGNPPYIRQEAMGLRDKRRIEKRLELDRARSPEIFWPRWSGRSDIYVYFFAHSTRLLKASGRLVFLTASSWLDVGYGAALREFLLKNFRVIAVIESAAESFFTGASINTSITVLARECDEQARNRNLVRFVQLTTPLSEILSCYHAGQGIIDFARAIERTGSSFSANTHRIRVIEQEELLREREQTGGGTNAVAGWGKYLRADDVFFRIIERGSARLRRLSELALVRFGVKTGANEFFYMREAIEKKPVKDRPRRATSVKAKRRLLALGDVASVRRGLTTGANEFFYLNEVKVSRLNSSVSTSQHLIAVEDASGMRFSIEPEYLAPVVFSLKEISGILLDRVESGKLFFNCSRGRADLARTKALEYIRRGERAQYHTRPTCAARELWYSVARGMEPAPLIFPSKVGERWVIALNRARVFEDKKLYGIFPRKTVSKPLLAALLNSTWARYYAEITCRQMTGAQAIADIDVAVAERIMIPDPRELTPTVKNRLEAALVELARRPVYSIFEEIKRADRRRLDELTLAAVGFRNKREREAILDQLYAAVVALVRARLNKNSSQKAERI
jgi:methylase of polypeptide subunit release factors